ncbi:ankyrin repeat protein [Colletotrichum karsti]|uniref:Ankyrin repeat protein n=1 Tax=Colletotrichum karsti TaxID=1095194 RepID=A0A9P6LH13_9PEZI|nr:ankyrin repeat protein [Colletotrichum karsti]KAF9872042.1 ankyrin repeat protein [Colletotrichum karsti]
MASLSSLGLNLRLTDIDENLKSNAAALSWPNSVPSRSVPRSVHSFVEDVPCFAYNEVFESGEVFQAVSSGSGIYLPLHSLHLSPYSQPAFTVSKCRQTKTIEVEVHSLSLLSSLAIAIPSPEFSSLLENYTDLRDALHNLEKIPSCYYAAGELRLLARDLLLDRALFAGIGTDFYQSQNLLGLDQLHDMHQRSVEAGLDDVDTCFSLGIIPDVVTDEYLEALTSKFSELALMGDLAGLQKLCEPVVRSGEIEWQTSPDLLLQLLDQGRLDIYRYILDLASRTKDKPDSQQGSWLSDITHDPLHLAIRLGHLEQVESFLQQGATFLGTYQSEEAGSGIVLTPLSAAAFWDQPDVVRLILRHNIMAEGAQEAAAIALYNNDTEMMEILLSSGVTNAPCLTMRQNAVDSFADLSIIDQPSMFNTAQTVTESPESQVRELLIGDSDPRATDTALQRPKTSLPKEPIQPKCSRRQRRLLGQDLVSCMHNMCSRLREVCECSIHDDVRNLGQDYSYANGVWERGIGVFRGLMQDNPPTTLVEVIDSLLVANSICLTFFKNDASILVQFYSDLDRWRSLLPGSSYAFFDEIAFRMWAFTPPSHAVSDFDPSNLPHFQGLVQGLISLEKRREAAPSRSSASGSRLSAIQRSFETRETSQHAAQGQTIPGRSSTRQTSHPNSSTQQDDFTWADFLHMDRFEDVARGQSRTPAANSWEDALSSTMILLASVAFSIVLSLMIGLHGSTTQVLQTIAGSLPGYARSYTLLAEYLAMHDVLIAHKDDLVPSAASSLVPPSPAYGSDAYLTPVSSFSSLNTLGMPRNMSSSSISSIGSSISRPPSRDHPTRGSRLPCPKPMCTKTFSSVSNRNKHVREGCAYTREKRAGESIVLQARNKADRVKKERDRPGLIWEDDDELNEGLEFPDHPGLVFGGRSKSELEEMFDPARYDFTSLPDVGENYLITPDNVPDGFEIGTMPAFEDLDGRGPPSPIPGFEFVPIPGTEGNTPGDGNLLSESLLGRLKRQKKQ